LREMLIVLGGLPGTGKTTISRELAKRLSATLLRIDVIEQAMLAALLVDDIGVAGYAVANALTEANLSNGQTVVADCVNPVEISRSAWKAVAARTESPLIQIEVVCTDRTEHRRRVEARKPDIPGHVLPTWETVVNYTYETWNADLVLDSAKLSTDEAVAKVMNMAKQMSR
jgi:predicted kinase